MEIDAKSMQKNLMTIVNEYLITLKYHSSTAETLAINLLTPFIILKIPSQSSLKVQPLEATSQVDLHYVRTG